MQLCSDKMGMQFFGQCDPVCATGCATGKELVQLRI